MSDYIGARCPVCHKKFTANDEIVVCPVCGAPHHRKCYEELGHCAFEQDHIKGAVWQDTPDPAPQPTPPSNNGQTIPPPNFQQQPPLGGWFGVGEQNPNPNQNFSQNPDVQICRYCGAKNPKDNLFCMRCGKKLSPTPTQPPINNRYDARVGAQFQYNPVYAVYGGLSPEEKIGDNTVRETATFIGPSSGHYLPRFKTFQEDNKYVTVNFSSFIFGFFYFFYRKMYLPGVVMLIAFIVSSVPGILMMRDYIPYTIQQSAQTAVLASEADSSLVAEENSIANYPYNEVRMTYYANMSNSMGFVYLVIKLIASLLANRLYYEYTMRRIKKVKAKHPTISNQAEQLSYDTALAKAGGVNKVIVVVSAIAVYVGYFVSVMFLILA